MKKAINLKRACLVIALLAVIPGIVFATGQQATQEVTEVSVFCMWNAGASSYTLATWFHDWLAKNLGVKLTFREAPGGSLEQYMNTQVAANDMADLFSFREPAVIANITGSGKMLNFKDHQAEFTSFFGNTQEAKIYANAIDFMTTTYGGAEKGLYAMPIRVGPNIRVDHNIDIRYDIWKQVGSPEIKTFEDLLPVLKKMQDAYPVNADGQKVYGFGLWAEWDKVGIAPITYMERSLGYDNEYASNAVSIYVDGSKPPVAITDKNGPYYRILKICYQANQMGLLDPDSPTHRYDALQAKDKAGRYLYHPVFWMNTFNTTENITALKGFEPVPRGDSICIKYADYPIGEAMNVWGIPKNSKHLAAAIKFYNWWWSFDGQDMLQNGPQGMLWDVNAQGKRYITDSGRDLLSRTAEQGGWASPDVLAGSGITGYLIHPRWNEPVSYAGWESELAYGKAHPGDYTIDTMWYEDHNALGTYSSVDSYLTAKGYAVEELSVVRAMPAMPTDIENKTNLIADVVKTASWNAIYAANETEFNRIWDECITKANGLGMQDVLQWTTNAWNELKASKVSTYKLPAGSYKIW